MVAVSNWPIFDGWCAARNVDPLDLDPARFCNLVYFWITRTMNEEAKAAFDAALEGPVKGDQASDQIRAVGRWSREAELEQFRKASR